MAASLSGHGKANDPRVLGITGELLERLGQWCFDYLNDSLGLSEAQFEQMAKTPRAQIQEKLGNSWLVILDL